MYLYIDITYSKIPKKGFPPNTIGLTGYLVELIWNAIQMLIKNTPSYNNVNVSRSPT